MVIVVIYYLLQQDASSLIIKRMETNFSIIFIPIAITKHKTLFYKRLVEHEE